MTIQIPQIELGNVVPGALPLPPGEKGVNETFIGHIDAPSGRHKALHQTSEKLNKNEKHD